MTTYTTWRSDVDEWVIHGVTEGGLHFDLPFSSEAARNEAWQILENENLGDRFLYATPASFGLLDFTSLELVNLYAKQVEADELRPERAGL